MIHNSAERSWQLTELIEARSNGAVAEVPQDSVVLENGASRLAIRLAGGFITDCQLTDNFGEAQAVLFCDLDTKPAKINASHFMSPVGANHGLGGQHGMFRWADYKVQESLEKHAKQITLDAEIPNGYPEVRRNFLLGAQDLIIRTILSNTTDRAIYTSMGEHLYWALPGSVNRIRVRNLTGEDPLDNPDIMYAVTHNDAQYWPGPSGVYDVNIPGGGNYSLSSTVQVYDGKGTKGPDVSQGLLLWQRAPKGGRRSFCIEPVAGLKGQPSEIRSVSEINANHENHQLELAVGAKAVMTTHIMLNRKA